MTELRHKADRILMEALNTMKLVPTEKSMNTKADRTIPDLGNATPEFLLDEIAKMRVETARLKFLDGVYKQALQARVSAEQLSGAETILGEKFQGHYETVTSERINSDKVKELLKDKPEDLKKVVTVITYKQLSTSPREDPV